MYEVNVVKNHTSWWPAPTSIQRKVRVRSSFVRSENAAKEAVKLEHRNTHEVTSHSKFIYVGRDELTEDEPWRYPSRHASSPPSDERVGRTVVLAICAARVHPPRSLSRDLSHRAGERSPPPPSR